MSFSSSSNSSSFSNGDNIPKEIRRGLKVSDLAYDKAYQRSVFVYKAAPTAEKASDGKVGQHDDAIVVTKNNDNDNDDGKIIIANKSKKNPFHRLEGTWANTIPNSMMFSPQEVWIFYQNEIPIDLYDNVENHYNVVHGIWGFSNHGAPTEEVHLEAVNPSQLLFYHCDEDLNIPSNFNVQGAWMLPIVPILNEINSIPVNTTEFLSIGKHNVDDFPSEVYNVQGQWKLLYHRDGSTDSQYNRKSRSLPVSEETPKIKVHIEKLSDGKTFTLDGIDPTKDTIKDLKRKIQDLQKIPIDKQDLYFDGTELGDDTTTIPINQYGIQDGDTLHLDDTMTIYVKKQATGDVFTLSNVKSTDTLNYIQHRIDNDHNIPVDEQRLSFKGKLLNTSSKSSGHHNNNKHVPLYEHGIQYGDTLHLEPMMIQVKTLTGKVVQLKNVDPTDTIKAIKEKIEKKTQIPPQNQRLVFHNTPLDTDTATLRSYGIKHGDMLQLDPMVIKIQKTSNGKIFPVRVEQTDTIADLKKKIESREGIPTEVQRLTTDSNKEPLDNDNETTLEKCGIQHGDILNLDEDNGMKIQVKTPEGEYIPLNVEPTDTILDIKQMVHSIEGTPVDAQLLSYKGVDLNDGENGKRRPPTLEDLNVKNGSILDMERMMQIYIQFPNNGRRIAMNVVPTWTIKLVKTELQKVCNDSISPSFVVNEHVLLYRGKLLENKMPLKRYNIQHRSTIHLEEIPESTVTMSPWQSSFDFSVSSSNSGKSTHRKSVDKDGLIKERRIPSDWLEFYELEKKKGKHAAIAEANGKEFIKMSSSSKNGSNKSSKQKYSE